MRRLAIIWLLIFTGASGIGESFRKRDLKVDTNLFNGRTASQFKIEIDPQSIGSLRTNWHRYVSVAVSANGKMYRRVGLRLKGNASFQPLHQKPSLSLKFDQFVPGQTFQGYKKIHLNNSSQDPTFLHEYLASKLFEEVGVPTASVTYCRVEMNQRDLGVYLLVEANDKNFLKRLFGDARGNLYEGNGEDVNAQLEQDHGKDSSQSDRNKLVKAALEEDATKRITELRRILNVDSFLSYIAMDMCLGNEDGYAKNRNNYRLYHDPRIDKMVFIPTGLDKAFGLGLGLRPPPGSLLVDQLYSLPQEHHRYWILCSNIVQDVWQLDILTNRINEAVARMLTVARNDSERADWVRSSVVMQELLAQRFRELKSFLKHGGIKPPEFNSDGIAHLTNWEPGSSNGNPTFQRLKEAGKPLLRTDVKEAATEASWRAYVYLPQGRYLLKARVKVIQTLFDPARNTTRVGLRTSGKPFPAGINLDPNRWQDLSCDIDVFSGGQEMELLAEIQSESGSVMFDVDAFELERVKLYPPTWQPGGLRPGRAPANAQ